MISFSAFFISVYAFLEKIISNFVPANRYLAQYICSIASRTGTVEEPNEQYKYSLEYASMRRLLHRIFEAVPGL